MRAFALFFGLMVLALAAMGVFAYPAWLLVNSQPVWSVLHHILDYPLKFHRLGERVGMIAAAVGFVLVARRAGLWNKQTLGYGLRRPLFIRELLLGLVQG